MYFVAISVFFVVFNMVGNNPFPVADPNDPDGGIGLWSVAFGLILTMSYSPLLLREKYILTGLFFICMGVVASIACEAFVIFLLFSAVLTYMVINSEDVRKMLLKPFEKEDDEK